jgi:peptidyl-prolyl cis-trans isomerase A (cyclophilin A)
MVRNPVILGYFVSLLFNYSLVVAETTRSGFFTTEVEGLYAEFEISWQTEAAQFTDRFVVELLYGSAPITSANFIALAQGQQLWRDASDLDIKSEAYYQNKNIHCVRPKYSEIREGDSDPSGYIVGGGPGPGYAFEDEIDWNLSHNAPGVVSMQSAAANSNGSQFMITTTNPDSYPVSFDGSHSIFGQVVAGQATVDAISLVERDDYDQPVQDVVFNVVECLVVGSAAEAFMGNLDTLRPDVSLEAVEHLEIKRAEEQLYLDWDWLDERDYFIYHSNDLNVYGAASMCGRTAYREAAGFGWIDLVETSAFFQVYAARHSALPSLAGAHVEMIFPELVGSNAPVVLDFGTNGRGIVSSGYVEPKKLKHVQASLLDHQQPAYSAQVDMASRSRSWGVWSKPVESGGGSMVLSGLDHEVATFEGPVGARAYIASVGAVENGHTYVFSLNVESSSGLSAITLAKLNGINDFTGASRITMSGGDTGRYAMKFTATADDPSVHFRVGIGAAGPISAEQTVVLSQPMLQDVTETNGRFDDWVAFPKATWTLPGNAIDADANSGRVVLGIGEELEDSSHPFALGFGVGDSFANNSGDWVNVLGRSVEAGWQGRFLGKGQPGGTLTYDISPQFDYYYDLLDAGYDYAVLQGGVNDVNSSTITLSNMQDAVRSMVEQLRAKGISTIFICNIAPWSANAGWSPSEQVETENYNGWLAAYCATEGLRLIDAYAALGDSTAPTQLSDGSGSKPNYDSGDGLHPSLLGHQVIADQILVSMARQHGSILKYSWLDRGNGNVQLHLWADSGFPEVQYYFDFTSEDSGIVNACVRRYYEENNGQLELIQNRPYSSRDGTFRFIGERPGF